MSLATQLRIGVAGYGMIGRLHTMGYLQLPLIYPEALPKVVLHGVATSRIETARAAQAEGGFAIALDDPQKLIADTEVDVVDVSLPNNLHRPVIEAALSSGKHVYCEKPLAGTVEDARAIYEATQGNPHVKFGMVFQYRFIPAIMKAHEIISQGTLGRIFTYRAEYLHTGYQNPNRPLTWRLQKEAGGSGALGDLGSHVIDLVRYLVGEFESVQGHLETFIDQRPLQPESEEKGTVTVDDVAWLRAKMANGAVGTIEASRFATGTLDDLRIWIYGERGSIHFNLMDPNYLYWFNEDQPTGSYGGSRGWQQIQTVQYYPGAMTPPARAPMGWNRSHIENQFQFLRAIHQDQQPVPGILDGLRTQLVIDATERSSQDGGRIVPVEMY